MTTATTPERTSKAYQRILEAAQELFYRQGYQATAVNEIIEAAGVSKPTFYAHFPSKETLCVKYLRYKRDSDLKELRALIAQETTPLERYLAPMRFLKERMAATDFRGCGFFNMLVEVTEPDSPILLEVRLFNARFRKLLRELTVETVSANPILQATDVERLTDIYCLLFSGAIMLSQEMRDLAPIDLATSQVRRLIE